MNNRNIFFCSSESKKIPTYSDLELFCLPLDLTSDPGFRDYREPNEAMPINIIPHLELMEKGWIKSCGTERSIYDLLLSPNCEGLLISDIHPKVIGYCRFLILLVYCANDREDFCNLSHPSNLNLIESLKEQVLNRIVKLNMPNLMISYFMENFASLALCYLGFRHLPPGSNHDGIDYRKNDLLFNKLQRYARNLKIIPVQEEINDFTLSAGRKVTVIDTSNISDYVAIKPFGCGDVRPRIIFTKPSEVETKYYSCLYSKFTDEENLIIEKYMRLFKDSRKIQEFCPSATDNHKEDIFNKAHRSLHTMGNVLIIKNRLIEFISMLIKDPSMLKFTGYASTAFEFNCFTSQAIAALKNLVLNQNETELEKILNNLLNEGAKPPLPPKIKLNNPELKIIHKFLERATRSLDEYLKTKYDAVVTKDKLNRDEYISIRKYETLEKLKLSLFDLVNDLNENADYKLLLAKISKLFCIALDKLKNSLSTSNQKPLLFSPDDTSEKFVRNLQQQLGMSFEKCIIHRKSNISFK